MEIKTLPIPVELISDHNDFIVDMSKPNFPTKPELQINSSIIFIRNTTLRAKLDFSKCSYKDKAEYLLTYMTKHYRLSVKELTTTWVKIIGMKYGEIDCESILTNDEIAMFVADHSELVNEMRTISASIPLCAIRHYCGKNQINIDESDVETSDYCGVNGWNFFNMLDVDNFINLVQIMDDVTPKYYTHYFVMDNMLMNKIYQRFPYLALLDIFMNPEAGDMLINAISDNLNPKKTDGEVI